MLNRAVTELVPAREVIAEMHICRKTLDRWLANTELKFPSPVLINRRNYFLRAEIEAWKASRARELETV